LAQRISACGQRNPAFPRRNAWRWETSLRERPVDCAVSDTDWANPEHLDSSVKRLLRRLLAVYLTASNGGKGPDDPVARFHLGKVAPG